jgi:hypothetical protein
MLSGLGRIQPREPHKHFFRGSQLNRSTLRQEFEQLHQAWPRSGLARVGPTSMRKPLSRPERDDCGTSRTSIRRHSQLRSALRKYAVAPIEISGVALRHREPRDAARVPLPISTWTASCPLALWAPEGAEEMGPRNDATTGPAGASARARGFLNNPRSGTNTFPVESSARGWTCRRQKGQLLRSGDALCRRSRWC